MTLIADSGSTKTTWVEVRTGNKAVTEGLNPHFTTDETFAKACAEVKQTLGSPDQVVFYGAGCGNTTQRQRAERLLKKAFGTGNVEVATDMLGACRAVSGDAASLVGILGTGSNACYYDGNQIAIQSPSLGYILGDEGSANHLGRMLLKDYYTGGMDNETKRLFQDTYPYTLDEWIQHVYNAPNANRFLAQLARFAVEHSDLKYCSDSIRRCVEQWYERQVKPLTVQSKCFEISIVGSYAKAIAPQLQKTLATFGLNLRNIVADPMEGMLAYHSYKIS